ncbi:unnamed protein product [Cuscuta campestris]|uniref:Uncharacterized protein n=1 Tax=Cuscuta campestris TaxID=132261 RepID=A0A484KYS7_9ASTE|nr:unnamed protein product [Cuscuta campestris]
MPKNLLQRIENANIVVENSNIPVGLVRQNHESTRSDQDILDGMEKKEEDNTGKQKPPTYAEVLGLNEAWYPGAQLNLKELSDDPIWVQFPGLDVKFWSFTGLGKLGSILGKPIKRDKATASRRKWDYARIQIEVQVQQDFPDRIQVVDNEGRVVDQTVIYEWKPTICSKCCKLGHTGELCRRKEDRVEKPILKKVWRPKAKEIENKEELRQRQETINEEATPNNNNREKDEIKQTWITEGDKNSKLFYAWAKKRQLNNYIMSIQDNGREVEGTDDIARVLGCFYRKNLGTIAPTGDINWKVFEKGKVLTVEQQLGLIKDFHSDQVRQAMFSIPSSKSPGPDGFNSEFYKKNWNIVGGLITKAILDFFRDVMEYLTRSFCLAAQEEIFHYHPMCARLNIINLSFADDLVVVCRADGQSIGCIMRVLEKFQSTTRLKVNRSKSEVIFGGISLAEEKEILTMLNMKLCKFPPTYLGSPITTARLRPHECDGLINKLTTRITFWGNQTFLIHG